MKNLDGVLTFTATWHDEPWCIDTLAAALSAEVRYVPMGAGFLGMSSEGYGLRLISLNTQVQDDPLLQHAILAHECGHLLAGTTRGGFCSAWRPDRTEPPAWFAAGLLCVSALQAQLHAAGHLSLEDVAEESAVPTQLANIGVTLRQRISDQPGGQPVLMCSLVDWLCDMQGRLKLLT